MRLLFIHERLGAFGGAEANVLVTATELRARGHHVALVHGAGTGRGEEEWQRTFAERFALPLMELANGTGEDGAAVLARALAEVRPDVIFLHKLSDLAVLRALAEGPCPVVRMVHDHDLWCMRGYKYNVFNRRICTRAASLFCVFPCGASICRGSGDPSG